MRIARIETRPIFERHYRKLPKRIREIAKAREKVFRDNPHHPSLETHKLHGKDKNAWAFSINQKYRIKFVFLSSGAVLFLDIGTHAIYD